LYTHVRLLESVLPDARGRVLGMWIAFVLGSLESIELKQAVSKTRGARGFTIVELAIVLVVVAVLLSFGVPRFRDAAERTRAGEAVQYLVDVRLAQDSYRAANGHFAQDVADLELTAPAPKHFELGLMKVSRSSERGDSWTLTVTRHVETSAYGAYTVAFNELGYDPERSSLGLLEQISPIEEYEMLRR
jgi:prepilin-type N-terminal cleavage/methylation domain-containing protein